MKRKIVMRLKFPTNDDQKSRAKVLKIAVSMPGTISAALEGSDKDQLVVVNKGVDTVKLTRLPRKKMGRAELINLTPVELTWLPRKNTEKDEEGGGEKKDKGGGGSEKKDKPDDSEKKDKEGGGRAGEKNDKANGELRKMGANKVYGGWFMHGPGTCAEAVLHEPNQEEWLLTVAY